MCYKTRRSATVATLFFIKILHHEILKLDIKNTPWRSLIGEFLVWLLVLILLNIETSKVTSVVSDETRLFLRGELTLDSVAQIKTALSDNQERFNTIQLIDSPGAGAAAGIIVDQIEALVKQHRLVTEVRGRCASACAATFLLGRRRTMLASEDGQPTYLMLHALRSQITREVNYGKTEAINKKIEARSAGRITLALLDRIFDDKNGTADGEVYIFREAQTTPTGKHHVFVCKDAQQALDQCEAIKGLTPKKLGLRLALE